MNWKSDWKKPYGNNNLFLKIHSSPKFNLCPFDDVMNVVIKAPTIFFAFLKT